MMFFTEDDIVSFGNYMMSSLRERKIREAVELSEDEDQIQARLRSVSDADLGNWAYLMNQAVAQGTANNRSEE